MESAKYGNKDLLFLSCIMVSFIVVVKISTTLPDAWFLGLPLSRPVSAGGIWHPPGRRRHDRLPVHGPGNRFDILPWPWRYAHPCCFREAWKRLSISF
jgi:hypothetical protein